MQRKTAIIFRCHACQPTSRPAFAIVCAEYQIELYSIMVSIPLITSIPPRISRLDAKGDEIGEAYQLGCIEFLAALRLRTCLRQLEE